MTHTHTHVTSLLMLHRTYPMALVRQMLGWYYREELKLDISSGTGKTDAGLVLQRVIKTR